MRETGVIIRPAAAADRHRRLQHQRARLLRGPGLRRGGSPADPPGPPGLARTPFSHEIPVPYTQAPVITRTAYARAKFPRSDKFPGKAEGDHPAFLAKGSYGSLASWAVLPRLVIVDLRKPGGPYRQSPSGLPVPVPWTSRPRRALGAPGWSGRNGAGRWMPKAGLVVARAPHSQSAAASRVPGKSQPRLVTNRIHFPA